MITPIIPLIIITTGFGVCIYLGYCLRDMKLRRAARRAWEERYGIYDVMKEARR